MANNAEKILSSSNLHEEWNEERAKKGMKEMPAINPGKGSTNSYCRMDKSWKHASDFFRQMILNKKLK